MSDSPVRNGVGVYVDGYNLYYGRLRGTPFKWLDLVTLSRALLAKRDQGERLITLKLFTAPALARFATHGHLSVLAQQDYHRALACCHGKCFEVIYGKHTFDRAGTLLPEFVDGQPCDRTSRVRVWKLEEKKTDVNLALHMYRDVSKRLVDRVIAVSNDSDIEPALSMIRSDFPHVGIGVVMPIRPSTKKDDVYRRPSGSLMTHADWVVRHLTDEQLREAQLPPQVQTPKKPIRKPVHW